jgi:hypothetical protein
MAVIHHTTLVPTKLELLAGWLPAQSWYTGTGTPDLARAGGFRLDDPAGEVGIEFIIVTDGDATYHVPLTYRAAPLEGATPIGTMEHGVLGTRYVYDGPEDPVLRTTLIALVQGQVQAQAQSQSNTLAPEVLVGVAPDAASVDVVRALEVSDDAAAGEVSVPWQRADGSAARGVVARSL